MALVIPKRHGVGFYAGQARSTKMFPAHGIGTQGTVTQGIITQNTITQSTIKLLSKDEARRIAVNIAKLPELLNQGPD